MQYEQSLILMFVVLNVSSSQIHWFLTHVPRVLDDLDEIFVRDLRLRAGQPGEHRVFFLLRDVAGERRAVTKSNPTHGAAP